MRYQYLFPERHNILNRKDTHKEFPTDIVDLTEDEEDKEVEFLGSFTQLQVSEIEKRQCVSTIMKLSCDDQSMLKALSEEAFKVFQSETEKVREEEEFIYDLELESIWEMEEDLRESKDRDFKL